MSVLGYRQSDIIATYQFCARVSPRTTLGEVSRPLWTKSDLLEDDFDPKPSFRARLLHPKNSVFIGVFEIEHVAVMVRT